MTLPVPVVHNVTVCETAWEEFALTGPSVIDDGLTQLKAPVDAVAEGETVGLRVGDGARGNVTLGRTLVATGRALFPSATRSR